MMAQKAAGLKPITREALRAFYAKYPLDPVPVADAEGHKERMSSLAASVGLPGSKVPELVGMPVPTRIDDIFWRNRCFLEEIAFNLAIISKHLRNADTFGSSINECLSLLASSERRIFRVQENNTEAAASQIKQFLPKDFRSTLLQMKQASGERRNQKAVEDLLKRGGTIREKYDLYLQQQWERREALAQMGQLTGMFKSLVKFIGGIPQVLLDFAKEINAKAGPMEEQRIKYGPDLYLITGLGIQIDVFTALWVERLQREAKAVGGSSGSSPLPDDADMVAALVSAVTFYATQLVRCLEFLGSIFVKSPFFLDANATSGTEPSSPAGGSPTPSVLVMEGLVVVPEDNSFHHALDAQNQHRQGSSSTAAAADHHGSHSSGRRRSIQRGTLQSPFSNHSPDGGLVPPKAGGGAAAIPMPLRVSSSGHAAAGANGPLVLGLSPGSDSARGGVGPWHIPTLGRASKAGNERGLEQASSMVSETWMSADDNASWYEGARLSAGYGLGGSVRCSHTGEVSVPASNDGGDYAGKHADDPVSGSGVPIVADSRLVAAPASRSRADSRAQAGCGCFGGRRQRYQQ